MPETFDFDVFLSHSSKDKAVVCPLAERLRKDGLQLPSCKLRITNYAFRNSLTFRFRDPLNQERRFILLRLTAGLVSATSN
jgi:hypothetical protein